MKAACSGPVGKGITIVIEVKGKFNTALCYTPALDGKAEEQIRLVCDEEAFRDSKIRIMPDVHAGKGCTIGTTMTITDKVVPGMVGVDIGCGMETVRIAQREIDSEKLDALIRSAIPCGREVRRASHEYCSSIDLSALRCAPYVNLERAKKSIGTLGGGNHFIEADRSDTGDIYIVVHSGSRHLGVEVADYYQEQGRMALWGGACALPGFVDSKNEEKTERNAGYLVVSHSGGGMLRQGTRKGIRRTPANRGMRAHRIVKSLDISEDVCHGLCP